MTQQNDDLITLSKEWWRSKAVIGGAGLILLGLVTGLGEAYNWDLRWVEPVKVALLGLSALGIRLAQKPIGTPKEILPPEGTVQENPTEGADSKVFSEMGEEEK